MLRYVIMRIDIKDEKTIMDACNTLSELRAISSIIKSCSDLDLMWYSNINSRKKLANELQISDSRVKQVIADLCSLGILIKRSKGIYKISKRYIQTGKFTE